MRPRSLEILACDEDGITVTLPKPRTSGIKAKGRFGKQDFVYLAQDDVYLCPAGERFLDFKALAIHLLGAVEIAPGQVEAAVLI